MKTSYPKVLLLITTVVLSSAHTYAATIASWNFGNSIAQDQTVAAPYGATTVASGASVSDIQFESGWLVISDQVDTRLGSNSLTIGSQTFNSDSNGTYAAIVDDNFTRSQFLVSNEGDGRNNSNPGKGMLQLLTPGQNITDIAESQANNLGFGFTVNAIGSSLDLNTLVLQAARFNSAPERSWESISLYADTGSGQFLLDSQGPTPLSPTLAPVTFDLTSLADITSGNNVVFRFYGDNGTGGDSTFGRELFIDDITLDGIVVIPEPSSLLLIMIGLGSLLLLRRHRA